MKIRLDVHVEKDKVRGIAMVADRTRRTAPGTTVEWRVDGKVITTSRADSEGITIQDVLFAGLKAGTHILHAKVSGIDAVATKVFVVPEKEEPIKVNHIHLEEVEEKESSNVFRVQALGMIDEKPKGLPNIILQASVDYEPFRNISPTDKNGFVEFTADYDGTEEIMVRFASEGNILYIFPMTPRL